MKTLLKLMFVILLIMAACEVLGIPNDLSMWRYFVGVMLITIAVLI